MKRSGHGHDPSGVAGTSTGECAVMCPACPHPGKNLPSDWEKAEKPKVWIYALFLAINANFHLKRLSASSDTCDPSLNQGSAYFFEEARYKEFLNVHTHTNIEEARTTASSVGTIECSQHSMKRLVFVGDLQKDSYPSNFVGMRAKSLNVRYLIPKFHLYMHCTHCQINYTFNLTPGVGHTDREAPERGWAAMNPVSSSTKEMGPGS
ncbi:hypothetical protein BDN71DRAFT_1485294 [Pleurotus eryngii]|uniref:Uncharacterized protein n=1 Tax=Pleurotus eryngii TaxID=5323 RepID=A0A9P5ZKN7_PLEER|nr:hypothetical protein BDN71DRAFT_1485294 [Pleurotus eryngii]